MAESPRKPLVDTNVLLRRLADELGSVGKLVPITEGEDSRAFLLRTGTQDLILRINRSRQGFDKDDFAARHFAGVHLPIPQVTQIGAIEDAFFCLSEHMPGGTLQALPTGEAFTYGAPVAALLHHLAKVPAPPNRGHGPFDEAGRAGHAAWQDFLLAPRQWSFASLPRDDRRLVDQALDTIEAHLPPANLAASLVHGDFGSNNVLVADGRITALIDWSEAMWGDPLYDLANILFWRPWLDCMEQQCRYFEAQEPTRLAQHDRLTAYQLRIGLQTLHDALVHQESTFAPWVLTRCRQIFMGACRRHPI